MTTDSQLITGNDLISLGWKPGPAIGHALKSANKLLNEGLDIPTLTAQLVAIHTAPDTYLEDATWGETAKLLAQRQAREQQLAALPQLRDEPAPLTVWGKELIDSASYEQINNAARLPVTVRVALMPDAHVGYGLPIGGVAALDGAIAPYMVGVDIGCRMHATILDRSPFHLKQKEKNYTNALMTETYFGRGIIPKDERNIHPILDDPRWDELPRHLRNLKDLAALQLGSSGGGNHFVEWTELTVHASNPLAIAPGRYIALVSHSGSRGVGYKLANYYSKMAEEVSYFLPKQLRKLGYLDYKRGEGAEYELAMTLAGDFAKANHEVLHARVHQAVGGDVLGTIQNHHNYAWRVDREDQSPIFVHRKGATPAEAGALGIIPGSMATPGFFVEGRGLTADRILESPSLNSASHGSGRVLGRRQAQARLDAKKVRAFLKSRGVKLIGGGIDEAPDAYKNPHKVLAAQKDLVRVWAEFMPVIVRMAADGHGPLGQQGKERNRSEPSWKRDRRKKNRRR